MEDKINFIEPLLDRAEDFGKTSLELLRLKTIEKTSLLLSSFISKGIAILVICFAIVAANIGAAFWLGDMLGKVYYGFFCVAGFYAVIGFFLFFILNNSIKACIKDSIIIKLTD